MVDSVVAGVVAHIAGRVGGAAAVVQLTPGGERAVGGAVGTVPVIETPAEEHGVSARMFLGRRWG